MLWSNFTHAAGAFLQFLCPTTSLSQEAPLPPTPYPLSSRGILWRFASNHSFLLGEERHGESKVYLPGQGSNPDPPRLRLTDATFTSVILSVTSLTERFWLVQTRYLGMHAFFISPRAWILSRVQPRHSRRDEWHTWCEPLPTQFEAEIRTPQVNTNSLSKSTEKS